MSSIKIGVLTSGGDAPGMNAAVRAVLRSAIAYGATPYAIYEGFQGAIDGGTMIRQLNWEDGAAILARGGTIIGTARSTEFREREGMKKAALNLVNEGIDRLVIIGGDGTLTGADIFRKEWPSMLEELVAEERLSPELAQQHAQLFIVGLVGSIDNDLVGTDSTIGTDTALARILTAIDQISSTAASHQRTFIIEVMGRHCGYLALMSAMAGGCDYVFIPEEPPAEGWEDEMVKRLRAGREAGRRESIIIVAEGAQDRNGQSIDSRRIADVIKEKSGVDPRVTILGHVQRGGAPNAFDRWMPTILGIAAVQEILEAKPDGPATILGVRRNRVARLPLVEAVAATRAVATAVAEGRYDDAAAARGAGFGITLKIADTMTRPPTQDVTPDDEGRGKHVAILHAGGLAPGMNAAARAAVRLGLAEGYAISGIMGGFPGFAEGEIRPLTWSEVDNWAGEAGSHLGTRREIPHTEDLYSIGRAIEDYQIDGLVIIGGLNAYLGAYKLIEERARFKSFRIPIVCVPASIDNNLPGAELSIGADSAVNNIVWALDRLKASAAASQRCFVAQTMGRYCGYLAQMGGIATGAELVYLHETGVTLEGILQDATRMRDGFIHGRELFLVVRNEYANKEYSLDFLERAFEQEGGGLFDVRKHDIGHLQQGGKPTAYDRLLAVRLANYALGVLDEQFEAGTHKALYVGSTSDDGLSTRPLDRLMVEIDPEFRRPLDAWWMQYREASQIVALRGSPLPAERIAIIDADLDHASNDRAV